MRQADRALGLLEDVLAIEVLMARDRLRVADADRALGTGTRAVLHTVEQALLTWSRRRTPCTRPCVHASLRGDAQPVADVVSAKGCTAATPASRSSRPTTVNVHWECTMPSTSSAGPVGGVPLTS